LIFDLFEYGFVRVASVSPKISIGDVMFNQEMILDAVDKCISHQCSLVLFPELTITGYTCADLFFQQILIKSALNSLQKIADSTINKNLVIIAGSPIENNGKLFNCAVVIYSGEILGIVPKTYLCNSNEYYEERWFSSEKDRVSDFIQINNQKIPFGTDLIFDVLGKCNFKFGLEICEDLWAVKPPSLDLAQAGASIIFNLSASNEYLGKNQFRRELVKNHSAKTISAYIYSSTGVWESVSDTIFSGSCLIAENGRILSETERFSFNTEICMSDIDIDYLLNERLKNNSYGFSNPSKSFREIHVTIKSGVTDKLFRKISKSPFVPIDENEKSNVCNEITKIQASALARRLLHINTKSTIIGISGGLDSTLALLSIIYAYKLINYDIKNIIAVNMPGLGTSDRTKINAVELAKLIGVTLKVIDIKDSTLKHFKDIGHFPDNYDITFENAQARIRTLILMDIANEYNGIVIGTGDLSELALGWCTYNGDHMSMYGVNAGIPKTLVKYLIAWYADFQFKGAISKILKDIIDTPISPELLPLSDKGAIVQSTENTIGPYILHDFFLFYSIRYNFSPCKVFLLTNIAFNKEFDNIEILKWMRVFYKRFFGNQFKRNAIPDGIKVGTVSLSQRADFRMPSEASVNLWLNEIDLMLDNMAKINVI
jgi:NAD+ synthase (glutamine-hydrolysing)